MARNLISSLLALSASLLPTIRTSASSSSNGNSEKERRAVEEKLERLMRTMVRIKATPYDAEEREIRDRSVKLWLKELKRVACDVEDVLGEYRYEATRAQVEARKACEDPDSHTFKRMKFTVPVPFPDGMVDRLDKIGKRFDEIAKDREALQLRESDGVRRVNNRTLRPPAGHIVDEANIFGRDAEVTEVIDLLLSEKEKQLSVISIIGKGGLGKTTIAQLVYKDTRVRKCFDLFGWVCVSEEFGVMRLTRATIESVCKINCGMNELSPLQEKLTETVMGKSILLVLDDVWNENQNLWELFQMSFKQAKLVRILVTTRNDKVAMVMQSMACYKPNYLPERFCWELFQHYAFGGTSYTMPIQLAKMGRKIMRKCGGLPLAVKSIAGLLRHDVDDEYWREILESDLWESNPSNDIFPALQISYAHLPTHLKPCFLFCSMYPKDFVLEKMNLIELWISQGFIESRGKRTTKEIGIEYYEELRKRSFLDDYRNNDDGFEGSFLHDFPNEYCKLHDIIHDLARLNSDEHYAIEIKQSLNNYELNILREASHLYATGFGGYVYEIPHQNSKSVRTLITNLKLKHLCCLKFEALRVLELIGYISKIPDSIAILKHLSYLRIICTNLKVLPSSIGLLFNLKTLIIDSGHYFEYLPDSIGDLANLRRLRIECVNLKKLPESLSSLTNLLSLVVESDKLIEVPSSIGQLSNLQELKIGESRKLFLDATLELPGSLGNLNEETIDIGGRNVTFNPHCLKNFLAMRRMVARLSVRSIGWLKDMKDLEGKLTIEGLENTSDLEDAQHANLISKSRIETLELRWCHYFLISDKLTVGDGEEDHVKLLIKKPDRSDEESDEGRLDGSDMSFHLLECLQPHPNLKKLVLKGYPSIRVPYWMGDPFSLQAIQEIKLRYCNGIEFLPFGSLHTLKHLELSTCYGMRVLRLDHVPSQLENLTIEWCCQLKLITGLQNLMMLAALNISSCRALESITMGERRLVESSEPFPNFSSEKPLAICHSTSSLRKLIITMCPLFCALPHELQLSKPSCIVWIYQCGCPDLLIRNCFGKEIAHHAKLSSCDKYEDLDSKPI